MSRDAHADWNRQIAVCARDTCGIATTAAPAPSRTRRRATMAAPVIRLAMPYLYRQFAVQENLVVKAQKRPGNHRARFAQSAQSGQPP